MDDVILARALHVLAVVIWIGGLSMATTIFLPGVRRGDFGPDRTVSFHALEHRFIRQVRAAHIVVGLSGFYMVWKLDLWARFLSLETWWMGAMLGLWILFAVLAFVIEPFVLHRHFSRLAAERPEAAFTVMIRGHRVLLALAVITILGAVAGSHGWMP
jgi:uncharacterized membrane protein